MNKEGRKEGWEHTAGERGALVPGREGAVSLGVQRPPCRRVVGGEFRAYLPRILLTQPWLTRSWREMSQGLTPWWARSTMR